MDVTQKKKSSRGKSRVGNPGFAPQPNSGFRPPGFCPPGFRPQLIPGFAPPGYAPPGFAPSRNFRVSPLCPVTFEFEQLNFSFLFSFCDRSFNYFPPSLQSFNLIQGSNQPYSIYGRWAKWLEKLND